MSISVGVYFIYFFGILVFCLVKPNFKDSNKSVGHGCDVVFRDDVGVPSHHIVFGFNIVMVIIFYTS